MCGEIFHLKNTIVIQDFYYCYCFIKLISYYMAQAIHFPRNLLSYFKFLPLLLIHIIPFLALHVNHRIIPSNNHLEFLLLHPLIII